MFEENPRRCFIFDILIDRTPSEWLEVALADFDTFLIDHAACERKASALAMSFVVKYPDRLALLEPMISLAKEELSHFHEVFKVVRSRGLRLQPDEKDEYVRGILKFVRHGREDHFLDRLLAASVIEARGCERFMMIGDNHPDEKMRAWYKRLGKEELGHYKVFINIARQYFSGEEIDKRFQEFVVHESEVMLRQPFRPRVH